MTSVPKPLKFLRPHYDGMKEFFGDMMDSELKTAFSDVLSVLGMTMAGWVIVMRMSFCRTCCLYVSVPRRYRALIFPGGVDRTPGRASSTSCLAGRVAWTHGASST